MKNLKFCFTQPHWAFPLRLRSALLFLFTGPEGTGVLLPDQDMPPTWDSLKPGWGSISQACQHLQWLSLVGMKGVENLGLTFNVYGPSGWND